MTAHYISRQIVRRSCIILTTMGFFVLLGLWLGGYASTLPFYIAFVILSGLVMGSLGLLMIGHLMSEKWLEPVRSEAQAVALTAPLLLLLGIPIAFTLPEIYPWARHAINPELPSIRNSYLTSNFFIVRSLGYVLTWTGLALWVARTENLVHTSAIGIAILAPTLTFSAYDWVLSREPLWWSSLFGFSFAVSQLLAVFSGTILLSLLRPEHPPASHMKSLERALLTLALLSIWVWFSEFLIVWLTNLPNEALWYIDRSGPWLIYLGIAAAAIFSAILVLVPTGFGRKILITGSTLLVLHHIAYMVWLLGPSAWKTAQPLWASIIIIIAVVTIWAAWCAAFLERRRQADPAPAGN